MVVTRPVRESADWLSALADAGHQPLQLPLMAFGPPPDTAALTTCLATAHHSRAWMFVSPQAVHAFFGFICKEKVLENECSVAQAALYFDDLSRQGLPVPRCWAPGPGTARALLDVGVPADCIDQPAPGAPQFDSEALWAVVGPTVLPGHSVLLIRGHTPDAPAATGKGRDWLAEQCRGRGATVSHCVAYSRTVPVWTAQQKAQARAASGAGQVWLLTSSESVGHLAQLMPGHSWAGTAALATHPRIAQAAEAMGFDPLLHSRPALADVLRALAARPPKMVGSP